MEGKISDVYVNVKQDDLLAIQRSLKRALRRQRS
jgi:hypothetical protein